MSVISRVLGAVCGGVLLLSGVGVAVADEDGMSVLQRFNCSSCHALTKAESMKPGLWRKGPALYYAGYKYNSQWVESWLQHPVAVRPTGSFYLDHVKSNYKMRNTVREHSFRPHAQLNREEARAVAKTLAGLKDKDKGALIAQEAFQQDVSLVSVGEMLFEKVYGCMSCHRVEPSYGGLSGPEMYTAGRRLTPAFILSYMRNPKSWEPRSLMPNKHVPNDNMQKIANYLVDLAKESFNE
ncbi:MAG: hypothetical protein Q9M13_09970 [Mariprofundales bacterium]|nr:hypothetical protein [Mariprofundales bacterium]